MMDTAKLMIYMTRESSEYKVLEVITRLAECEGVLQTFAMWTANLRRIPTLCVLFVILFLVYYEWFDVTALIAKNQAHRHKRKCALGTDKDHMCPSIIHEQAQLADKTGEGILEIMKQFKLKCVYIACPLWSLDVVDYISKYIPRDHIFVSGDIQFNKKIKKEFFSDYYLLSLVEQEICHRAVVFIRSHMSNWSAFVEDGRTLEGKVTCDIRDLPGMPPNIQTF
ncbi:uncharacterized protein LOC144447098 [Glandiceps talaboti]